MKTSHVWAICVAALLCLHLGSSFTNGADTGNPFFTYNNGPAGPARWGNYPGWETCKTGRMQSPMLITHDIKAVDYNLDGKLNTNYPKGNIPASIFNNGHTVEVALKGLKLKIGGVEYESTQMHVHYPSEHTLFGYRFALELHLVHVSAAGKIAVVGWLFNLGNDSPFLAQYFDKLPTYTPGVEPKEQSIGRINFSLSTKGPYGRYTGSLTTPPCSEGVTWTLMLRDYPTVSQKQLAQLKAVLPSPNARPSQPPNGRKFHVTCY